MDLTFSSDITDKNDPRVSQHLLGAQSSNAPQPPLGEDPLSPIQTPPPSFLHRLGTTGICVVFGGVPLTLAALGFIIFLWSSDGDNRTWRSIVLSNWTTRSITLASLAIRWAIVAQSCICTSMLAAMALHRYQVLLPDSAKVSAMRFLNMGPHSLLGPSTRPMKIRTGYFIWLMVVVLSLTTFLSQFTSTILLSDLHNSLTPSDVQHSTLNYGLNISRRDNIDITSVGSSYWTTKPGIYPTFAEYSEEGYLQDHVHDTGVNLRAFMPIGSQAIRASLRNYSGYASVLDTRVVCVRPTLDISINFAELVYFSEDPYVNVTGNVQITNTPASPFPFVHATQKFPFTCTAPLPQDYGDYVLPSAAALQEWLVSMCPVDTSGNFVALNDSSSFYSAFLILNTTGTLQNWRDAINPNSTWYETEHPIDNEWTIYNSTTKAAKLGISFCLTSFDTTETPISALAGQNHTEPQMAWDPGTRTYDTLALRTALGTVSNSTTPTSRKLLQMSKPSLPTSLSTLNNYNTQVFSLALSNFVFNTSIFMCNHCYEETTSGTTRAVNPAIAALFNDVLRTTQRPGLSIQALVTTLAAIPYYDFLQVFDVGAPATYTTYVQALMPTKWMGLESVLVVLFIHTIFVIIIVATFATTAKESLIGNAWSVFAQTCDSPDAKELLERSDMKRDGEVKEWVASRGDEAVLVGVGVRAESGRMELRKR